MADSFGFGASTFGTSGFNTFASNISGGGFNWKHFLIGAVVAAVIALLIYFVIDRADTRPIVDGYADVTPFIDHPAPAVPPEKKRENFADKNIYSDYVGHVSSKSDVLLELQELEAKLAAFKHDITSPAKTIDASKLVQYNTYQDIRPLADWTSQCFSKNVPERDIQLQMDRWLLSGKKTLADLNSAAGFSVDKNVERLTAIIEDVKRVALSTCLSVAHTDIQGLPGAHDPESWGSATTTTSANYH